MNDPNDAAAAAFARSASESTTNGALPPSSSTDGVKCSAHLSAMILPTPVEPVKFTRRTAGWAMSSSTTSGASSVLCTTKLMTPGGRPASCRTDATAACTRGARLGRLEDHRVAEGQRRRDRARREDDRRVPRRHAEHDAGGPTDRERL